MPEAQTTASWPERWRALRDADGEDWDALHEALERDWKAAYRETFIAYASARGWDRENAESWCSEIVGDAFIERRTDYPRLMAQDDVRACERETENA
jgi:hypothetical protein